jgi:hypothetical protein
MAKKIDVDLDQIEELAAKGYSVTMICNAVGINRTTAYSRTDIKDTIKRGVNKARQEVIDHLMSRSLSDQGATASIFLAKQLKVFEDYFTTSTPKTPTEATERIAKIYDAVSKNELNQDKADKLVSYMNAYIKAYEISDLEQRIQELENVTKK